MDTLSDTDILKIINNTHPDITYINSTIGYIKKLITPIIHNFDTIIFPEYMSIMFKNKTKNQITNILLSDIIFTSGNYVRDKLSDNAVYPWDINNGLLFDAELRNLLGIKVKENLYDVNINQHKYKFSPDVIIGLTLFNNVYKSNYKIYMYDYEFLLPNNSRYLFQEQTKYKITIGNHDYGFDNIEFLQGFASGASWNNVDHHKYWKNLYNVDNGKYYTFN